MGGRDADTQMVIGVHKTLPVNRACRAVNGSAGICAHARTSLSETFVVERAAAGASHVTTWL